MNHPFIIKYLEEFVYEERVLCIVTQFVAGGDFDTFMNTQRKFTEEQAMHYFSMILLGLHFMHKKGIIHRDLKPGNILIENFKIAQSGLKILKITDFGISKMDIE